NGGSCMRVVVAVLVGLVGVAAVCARQAGEKAPRRYLIDADLEQYPQDTPEKALKSAVKAIDGRKIDYLLAQLADPEFVDRRVEEYKADFGEKVKEESRAVLAFDKLVKETAAHFRDDPSSVKELQRFAREGEWETGGNKASAKLKDLPARR